ncbi:MAG: LON peptidase substrate-binding domain-containing protein [Bryobacteraceae bacterium]
MKQQLLSLFPLQVVLFPRTPLPLHIFEERYKQMIADVIAENSEFGVVLAGDKGICNMGCSAAVDKIVEKYPDGRMDLLTIGRRRFEILALDEEKPYLRGEVTFFDDEEFEPTAEETRQRVLDCYKEMREAGSAEDEGELDVGDSQVSFQIADAVPDLNFRQMLLATRSESERMKQLAEYLPSFASRQRKIQYAKTVAPRNGHASWPSSL